MMVKESPGKTDIMRIVTITVLTMMVKMMIIMVMTMMTILMIVMTYLTHGPARVLQPLHASTHQSPHGLVVVGLWITFQANVQCVTRT